MVAYTTIPNSDIDAESPITEDLLRYLRNNPIAIASNYVSAPNVVGAAIANNAIIPTHFVRSEYDIFREYQSNSQAISSAIYSVGISTNYPENPVAAQLWAKCVASTQGYIPGDVICVGMSQVFNVNGVYNLGTVLEIGSPSYVELHTLNANTGNLGMFTIRHASTGIESVVVGGDGKWEVYINSIA